MALFIAAISLVLSVAINAEGEVNQAWHRKRLTGTFLP